MHKDPFINLLNTYFQSYHNSNVCSSKSALTLTILLWKLFNKKLFLDQKSEHSYDEILNEVDKIFKISIEKLKNEQSLVQKILPIAFETKMSGRHRIILMSKKNEEYLKSLIYGLCRSQFDHSDLIWNIFKFNKFKLDSKKLSFIIDDSAVEDLTSANQNWYFISSGILFELQDQIKIENYNHVNGIIVDACLIHNYTHLGYNKDIKFNKIVKSSDFSSYANHVSSSQTMWLDNVKNILKHNHIKLLVVSGTVDKDLLNFCSKENIVVFMSLSAEKFKIVKEHFKCANVIVYIQDFSQDSLFKCKLERFDYKNYVFIKSTDEDDDNNGVISVLIMKNLSKFFLKNQIKMFIEELKHHLKRFENVLTDKLYAFNYDAKLESTFCEIISQAIYNRVNDINCDDDDEINFSLAKEILYETFVNYKHIVSSNVDENDIVVIDDLKSKINSWQFALEMNRIFLNINFSLLCS